MDAVLLAVAFFFGLVAQHFRLPPLVGFLISGFVLQAFGQSGGEMLGLIADLGVTLMLFTIGVKLRAAASPVRKSGVAPVSIPSRSCWSSPSSCWVSARWPGRLRA